MKAQSKQEILKSVSDLLDQPDCVVRLQRELVPETPVDNAKSFTLSDRVTCIIVATKAKEKK